MAEEYWLLLMNRPELLPFSSLFMEKISLPADKNNIAFTFSEK